MAEALPFTDSVTITRNLQAGATLAIVPGVPMDPEQPWLATSRLSYWPENTPEEAIRAIGFRPSGRISVAGRYVVKAEASPLADGYSGSLSVGP